MTLPHSLVDQLTDGGMKQLHVHPITNGLIHATFRLTIDQQPYLLQSVNTKIFPNPEGLIQNHLILHTHFCRPDSPFNHPLAKPLRFSNDEWLFIDETAQHWRLSEFIPGTYTRSAVEDPTQAEALASFFARFTGHASTIDLTNWHVPLPGFHDLRGRFDQFEQAIRTDVAGRKKEQPEQIDEGLRRIRYVDFFDRIKQSNHHPLRMMHHDAKLSNVLIDARSEEWRCAIDLDTVMPGYFFSDIGDMVRSICNSQSEEDGPPDNISFRSDLYEALLQGYRKGLEDVLTGPERQQLDMAGILMTYMQAIRFLTDHLNGDVYYQTDRPGQNLDRALNQFTLLQKMESYLGERLNRSMHC